MNLMDVQKRCRSCAAPLEEVLIEFASLPVAGAYVAPESPDEDPLLPLTLMRCAVCGLVQLRENLLPDFYHGYRFTGGLSSGYKGHLCSIARRLTQEFPPQSRVLEIGSSDGTLLEMLRDGGLVVGGFEPAQGPARISREKGLDVVGDFFGKDSADKSPVKSADVVIIRHVLEHIDNFEEIFAGLRKLENPSLLIEVPDLFSTVSKQIYGSIYHAHPCYFDIASLTYLLEKYGWFVETTEVVDIFGGSLLVSAGLSHESSARTDRTTPGASPVSSEELDLFVKGWKKSLVAIRTFFEGINSEGLRVAGYGAGERTTAILGTTGLGQKHISRLYDKNTAIQGFSLPGSRIPIKDPGELIHDKPDALVVFAQSFEEEIISEQAEYQREGGRFISMRTVPPSFIS